VKSAALGSKSIFPKKDEGGSSAIRKKRKESVAALLDERELRQRNGCEKSGWLEERIFRSDEPGKIFQRGIEGPGFSLQRSTEATFLLWEICLGVGKKRRSFRESRPRSRDRKSAP